MEDEIISEDVGSIIAATGYDLVDWSVYEEITAAANIPMLSPPWPMKGCSTPSGPTGGHIKRPSDGKRAQEHRLYSMRRLQRQVDRKTVLFGILLYVHCKTGSFDQGSPTRFPNPIFSTWISGRRASYTTSSPGAPWKNMEQIISVAGFPLSIPMAMASMSLWAQIPAAWRANRKSRLTLLYCPWVYEASAGAPALAEKLRISYDSYGFLHGKPCREFEACVKPIRPAFFWPDAARGPRIFPLL